MGDNATENSLDFKAEELDYQKTMPFFATALRKNCEKQFNAIRGFYLKVNASTPPENVLFLLGFLIL
jgi:hypothetical protein